MSSTIKPYRLPSPAWQPSRVSQAPQVSHTKTRSNSEEKKSHGKWITRGGERYLDSSLTVTAIPEALLGSLSLPTDTIPPNHTKKADRNTLFWISRHPVFQTWQRERHGVLWIRGSAGSGKSTLMKYLASQAATESTPSAPNNGSDIYISFFFNSAGHDIHRSRLGLVRDILCQLIRQFPAAFDQLARRLERVQSLLPASMHVLWDAQELLDEIVASFPVILKANSVRIVVDAIDLCGEETAKRLMQDFQKLVERASATVTSIKSTHSFKIVFSSGPLGPQEPITSRLIQLDEQNGVDIETYVRQNLPNTEGKVRELIARQSAGSFLTSRLLIQSLQVSRDPSTWFRRQSQTRLAGDALSLVRSRFQDMARRKDRQTLLLLMTWACFSIRPLTLSELRIVVCTSATASFPDIQWPFQTNHFALKSSDDDFETWVSAQSEGLLEVVQYRGKKMVQPIHELVREFIVSEGLELLAPGSASEGAPEETVAQIHFSLVQFCIKYISLVTQEADWEAAAEKRAEFQLLSYAGLAWTRHAALSYPTEEEAAELLELVNWPSQTALADLIKVMVQHPQNTKSVLSTCPYGKLDGISWLHLLAVYGLDDLLQVALQKSRADEVDFRDSLRRTPLYAAVCCGNAACVKTLLKNGADVSIVFSGQSLLHMAALQGQIGIEKILMSQSSDLVCSINPTGQTPIFSAVLREHVASIKLLLQNHAKVNSYDGSSTPVLLRATAVGSVPVVRVLLDAGAFIDQQDQGGFTALHTAVSKGHDAVVRLLVDRGCEVNIKDNLDRSALLLSVSKANEVTTKYLLQHGADATVMGEKGRNLLLISIEKGRLPMAKLLLDAGFNPNSKDKNGRTMLMAAVSQIDYKLVKLLLDYKGSIAARDKQGNSVIFYVMQTFEAGKTLSEDQEAICALLFRQYGETVVSWDPDWKRSHELFLSSTGSPAPAQAQVQEVQAPVSVSKDIPFFSSQSKPIVDELMFGSTSQNTTAKDSPVPHSLKPGRTQAKGSSGSDSIPSFLMPGGALGSKRLSLQETRRPASEQTSLTASNIPLSVGKQMGWAQRVRSWSDTRPASTSASHELDAIFMNPPLSSAGPHSLPGSGSSSRRSTPEPHPLQKPGSNLLFKPYAAPGVMSASYKTSPLSRPYEKRTNSGLRDVDHDIISLNKTDVPATGASVPSALRPGSAIFSSESSSRGSSPGSTPQIKPYPGASPPEIKPFSTTLRPASTLYLDSPPVIPPLNLGQKQSAEAANATSQGSQVTTVSGDWFSKFTEPPSSQNVTKAKSSTPTQPTREAPLVPTALQPGAPSSLHARKLSITTSDPGSGVKKAAVAAGVGAAAGLAGGSLLHSELVSTTTTTSENTVREESLTFQTKRVRSNDLLGSELRSADADSDWEGDDERGQRDLADDNMNHGHALAAYSPADYGGHWDDDDYTSQVASSDGEDDDADQSGNYYGFDGQRRERPVSALIDTELHFVETSASTSTSTSAYQYANRFELEGTNKTSGEGDHDSDGTERNSGGYDGSQHSYNNAGNFGAKYRVV